MLGTALDFRDCPMVGAARGQEVAANPGQQVQLPYTFHDNLGTQWDVQPDGCIGPATADIFDAGGRLYVGGNGQYSPNAPTAQLDPIHNELIFPSQMLDGLNVSRRICVDARGGWCRWIEVLENPGTAAVKTLVHVNFDLGGNVQASQVVIDERTHKPMSLAVFDGNRGIAMAEAGHGSPVSPNIVPQQGNDQVDVTWEVVVPAHKTVGILHLQAIRPTVNQAQSFLEKLSDREVLRDLPANLRKAIINFPTHALSIGDMELLRGDLFDIVELRGGDQYKGAVQETALSLQTAYGPIALPIEKVLAISSVGEFRPTQLVITREGEAFGGTLQSPVIHLKLSSGQVTPIPVRSIKRLGFRKHPGEPEEFKYDHAMLMLRNGDRIAVQVPGAAIAVATRYGNLLLKPETVGALVFQGEDLTVHQVLMTDGSRMAALVGTDTLELRPVSIGGSKPVSFPLAWVSRLQLAAKIDEPDDQAPILTLTTGDRLVGALGGKLLLETAFDTIEINGAEVRSLHRAGSAPTEMQVTLWDDTTFSGRLQGDVMEMGLKSGPVLRVPAALLEEYAQPEPMPPASVLEKLRALVLELGSDDWKQADRASAQLGSMGRRITGALKTLRPSQGKPVQDRIDGILSRLASEPSGKVPPADDATRFDK